MKDKRYTYSAHTVHNIKYHLIWCLKYRRRVLAGDIEKRLRELLKEKAADIGIHIVETEIMSDHVHVFVHATPVDSPHYHAVAALFNSSKDSHPGCFARSFLR